MATLPCPRCNHPVEWVSIRAGSIVQCSSCRKFLRLPASFGQKRAAVAHVISLAEMFGIAQVAPHWWLIYVYVPVFFLNLALVATTGFFFFPPVLEECQEDTTYSGPLGLR